MLIHPQKRWRRRRKVEFSPRWNQVHHFGVIFEKFTVPQSVEWKLNFSTHKTGKTSRFDRTFQMIYPHIFIFIVCIHVWVIYFNHESYIPGLMISTESPLLQMFAQGWYSSFAGGSAILNSNFSLPLFFRNLNFLSIGSYSI